MSRRGSSSTAAAAAVAAGKGADAAFLSTLPFPPHPPLAGSEPGSFAEGTIKTRLPAIMDTVLSDLARLASTPAFDRSTDAGRQVEAAAVAVRAMQAEMPCDARVAPLVAPAGAPEFLGVVVEWTNAAVEAWQKRGQEVRGWAGG